MICISNWGYNAASRLSQTLQKRYRTCRTSRKKRAPERKEKIRHIIHTLANEMALEAKYLDHKLKGEKGVFKDRRECHVEPDLLLVYKIEKGSLFLERIGSHSELFE